MLNSFVFRRIASVLLVCIALSGCKKSADVPVTIGTNIWLGYEPGYIAKDLNLYGVTDVTLRQLPSATEVLRAFRNESIDVAALTLDEALMILVDKIERSGGATPAKRAENSISSLPSCSLCTAEGDTFNVISPFLTYSSGWTRRWAPAWAWA